MKYVIYAVSPMLVYVLKQMRDGSYERMAECDTRADADTLVQALIALDAEMSAKKKDKK